MPASTVCSTVCTICGELLHGSRDCLACLLRGGLEGPNDGAVSFGRSFAFGDFEIKRRKDGSLWELGHGAMGVTYRARDQVLHRDVALKVIDVLAGTGGAQMARERFLREARAVAALRHPNVAGVFQFGAPTEAGRCYYAMELVEGETLEAIVRREGPLPAVAALEMGIQVARALVAAAEHALIHRDLKPANIMLVRNHCGTEMEVKVIDFGLAKVTAGATNEMDLTQGAFVGTPTFASPEQFAGQAADSRSDIYSLGVTLWYALTGAVPHQGKTIEEIRSSREQLALPVEQLQVRKLPASVISLLSRALATDPAERPQSARAMLGELESCQKAMKATPLRRQRIRRATVALGIFVLGAAGLASYLERREQPAFVQSREKSIAVLPFENLSKDDANAFFAAGIQDDVLTSLAKIHELRVISHTSVTSYQKPGSRNMREIGWVLGVENVLEGSVRREGDRVLLNVQLIDARTDRQLWAERYDRTGADAIGLQGELASEIAAALQAKLAPEEAERLAKKPTANPEAYALYLRGLGWERVVNASDESRTAAEQLYARAIALDPKFALARARLSIVESRLTFAADGPNPGAKARQAAEEALRLSPSLGEGHMALGLCLYWADKNYSAALKEFSMAAATLPNEPDVLGYIAGVYRRQGRWHDSIATFQRAQELDPRNVHVIDLAAHNFLFVRDWPAATECYNRAQEIAPDSAYARIGLAYLEVFRESNPTAAGRILQSGPAGIDPDGNAIEARWDLAMLERDYPTAEKILTDFPLESFPRAEDAPKSIYQGRIAMARGDTESAQRYFVAATPEMEAWVRARPDEASRHASLGMLYAYQRRKSDALREGLRAVELEPESQNAFHGAIMAGNLAAIYALVGETDRALELIERLLAIPGPIDISDGTANITLADLRLRQEWDPLRSDPRFQKILAGPEPKTIYQ
ncbi:MAG: protein kinase domain-containing protein [Chthoniobacterales bacterium]